jgi:uncharacterized membrane protein YfcA
VWLSLLFAADDAGAVLPLVGVGGGGLSAVLLYLLLDSNKERRALQASYDALLMQMLPVLTAVTTMQDRVLAALSTQVEHHDRRSSDPEVLRRAYDQLEKLLDEYPPPQPTRRRGRGDGQ